MSPERTHDIGIAILQSGSRNVEAHQALWFWEPKQRAPLVACPTLVLLTTEDQFADRAPLSLHCLRRARPSWRRAAVPISRASSRALCRCHRRLPGEALVGRSIPGAGASSLNGLQSWCIMRSCPPARSWARSLRHERR